jgi:hypothetical protein
MGWAARDALAEAATGATRRIERRTVDRGDMCGAFARLLAALLPHRPATAASARERLDDLRRIKWVVARSRVERDQAVTTPADCEQPRLRRARAVVAL